MKESHGFSVFFFFCLMLEFSAFASIYLLQTYSRKCKVKKIYDFKQISQLVCLNQAYLLKITSLFLISTFSK